MRAGIESTTASTEQAHLVSLSDSTRAMVFEIITQYRAVFNDDVEDDDEDFSEPIDGDETMSYTHSSAILFDWTSSCVSDYLERLETGIKDIRDGAALNTVLQQAMYCGQSLGRVGADFRAALPPLFEDAVLRIYNSHLNAALRQFEMMIEDNRWAPVGSSALRKDRGQGFPGLDPLSSSGKDQSSTDDEANDQYDPPIGVLDSPPLAVFLNGILAALNELRLCAPISLGSRLGKSLQETLISAGEYMSAVGGPGGAFLKRSDRQHFTSMSASLRDLCVQHAARCLDHCMDRNGLVDVTEVQQVLTDVFGETLVPVALSKETTAKLNGTEYPVVEVPRDAPGQDDVVDEKVDESTENYVGAATDPHSSKLAVQPNASGADEEDKKIDSKQTNNTSVGTEDEKASFGENGLQPDDMKANGDEKTVADDNLIL